MDPVIGVDAVFPPYELTRQLFVYGDDTEGGPECPFFVNGRPEEEGMVAGSQDNDRVVLCPRQCLIAVRRSLSRIHVARVGRDQPCNASRDTPGRHLAQVSVYVRPQHIGVAGIECPADRRFSDSIHSSPFARYYNTNYSGTIQKSPVPTPAELRDAGPGVDGGAARFFLRRKGRFLTRISYRKVSRIRAAWSTNRPVPDPDIL